MDCTTYNADINYNAVILYNGECVSPEPFSDVFGYIPPRRKIEEDFPIPFLVLELLDDEY